MHAIIDTGCHQSCIDADVAKQLNLKHKSTTKQLIGAGGGPLVTVGDATVKIKLRLGNMTKLKKHSLIIVKDLTAPMLLGLELLSELEVIINLKTFELSFPTDKLGIRTIKDEVIPPMTQTIIGAKANVVGTIITVPFSLENGLCVANSVPKVTYNKLPIVVMNPCSKSIMLKANTQIASMEKIEDTHLNKESVNKILELQSFIEPVKVVDNLSNEQMKQLYFLLEKYKQAFSLNGEIGLTNVHKHVIELLPDAEPFAEPLRRRALVQIEDTRKQVEKLLKEDIIEESSSPWASAYVLVKKKNGEVRFCIDFRKLNSMTKKVVYPLPNIEDCLETLSGKNFFSQIYFRSGSWQIAMDDNSKELTTFRTEDGLYHFKRMPFGLTNAPASFQKMINTVLSGLKGINLLVFVDDVCIATKTWGEHLMMLRRLFEEVIKANLKINASKCVFAADKVKFLGQEISEKGIKQDPDKLKALLRLKEPRDAKELKRILGMFSYYWKFVDKFALLAEPLTKLTKKNVDFIWNDERHKAYREILSKLESNPVLAHFNHVDPILVKTDASRQGVAGMLLQKHDGDWKLVTCCSRRFSGSETNYGITDLEWLAVVYTVTKLRPYLLGKRF